MDKPTLVMTVGLPRSGKSTWTKTRSVPIVCPDQIRYAMHGQRYQALAEPFVWATAKVMVRALFLSGHTVVILDATNTTQKARNEWKSPDWKREFKIIPTAANVCIERAKAENDEYIIPIIERMAKQYEAVTAEEED